MTVIRTGFIAAILGVGYLAHADQVLYSETFESTAPPNLPGGWWVPAFGNGTPPAAGLSIESSSGNPGQNLLMSVDSSEAAPSWGAIAEYRWVGTLPTANFADIILTVDLVASEVNRDIFIHFWSFSTSNSSVVTGKADWGGKTSSAYTTIGGSLANFMAGPNTLDTNAPAFLIGFRMQSDFGHDAGNTFRIDNVRLSVVPEPGILSIAMVGGTLLLSQRIRKRSKSIK